MNGVLILGTMHKFLAKIKKVVKLSEIHDLDVKTNIVAILITEWGGNIM